MLRSPAFDKTDLSTLRKGYYGASIMPVEVLLEMQRRLPNVRLWNFYGQTEIAPLATMLRPEDQVRKAGSAGKPVLNVETRVVDTAMEDVEPGEIGEIVHRIAAAALGYWNDQVKTAAAFRGGWFHSGDLATSTRRATSLVVDREKDMIKTGGENVASREVEETVYRLPRGLGGGRGRRRPIRAGSRRSSPSWWSRPAQTLTEEAVIEHCAGEMALQDARGTSSARQPAEEPERQAAQAGSA